MRRDNAVPSGKPDAGSGSSAHRLHARGSQWSFRDLDAYHHLYGNAADLSRVGDHFQGTLDVLRLPRLILHERRVEGVVHSRTWMRTSRDGFDHITLHLLLAGDLVAGPPGAERRLRPGEIAVLDTSRPHVSQMRARANLISVQLARAHVQEVIPDLGHIHGAVLPAETSALLAGFLTSLTQQSSSRSLGGVGHIATAAINLLSLSLNGLPATASALTGEAVDTLRRKRAEAFIAARLSDLNLDVNAIAAGIGTSRSVLYRVFGVDGGVKRFIQQRRLDGLRRALMHPGEVRRFGSLSHAYGFTSESHCNRAFSATYGLPPGRFRAELRADRSDVSTYRDNSLVGWAKALY